MRGNRQGGREEEGRMDVFKGKTLMVQKIRRCDFRESHFETMWRESSAIRLDRGTVQSWVAQKCNDFRHNCLFLYTQT